MTTIMQLRRQVNDLEARCDRELGLASGDITFACQHPDGHWQCCTMSGERVDLATREEVMARAVPWCKVIIGVDLDVVCGDAPANADP